MTEPQEPTKAGERVSRCTPEDIEGISQFLDKYRSGELFFYSKKTIRRMVLGDDEGRKPYDIFLSKDNGKIIGIAIVSSKSKTLSLLFVSPEYRDNGIGRELYNISNPKQILAKRSAIPYFAQLESPLPAQPADAPAQSERYHTWEIKDDGNLSLVNDHGRVLCTDNKKHRYKSGYELYSVKKGDAIVILKNPKQQDKSAVATAAKAEGYNNALDDLETKINDHHWNHSIASLSINELKLNYIKSLRRSTPTTPGIQEREPE